MNTDTISKDFILINLPGVLRCSKSRSYRESTLALYTSLCCFLQENQLVTTDLVTTEKQISDTLQVRRDQFTDVGFELFYDGVQKWLRSVDRGTSPTDTTILERELKKLRGNQPSDTPPC